MKYVRRIWEIVTSGANLYKTVLFNFRMLPIQEAIRFPIWLYGKVDISRSIGKIKWINPLKIHTGGWRIGQAICVLNGTKHSPDLTILSIQGTLYLGEHGHISNGCRLYIRDCAEVKFGDSLAIGERCRICSYCEITIGNQTRISWDSQLFDTDFHYVIHSDGEVNANKKRVDIGNRVWIGNHVTIAKGAAIGDECIIASNSLLNRDYSNIKNGLFVGSPAKLKKEDVRRVFDFELEHKLDLFFDTNKDVTKCVVRDNSEIVCRDKIANTPPMRQ